jgi:hypothetical protein
MVDQIIIENGTIKVYKNINKLSGFVCLEYDKKKYIALHTHHFYKMCNIEHLSQFFTVKNLSAKVKQYNFDTNIYRSSHLPSLILTFLNELELNLR